MKFHVKIDTTQCIGCGICRELLPEHFILDGYTALFSDGGRILTTGDELLVHRIRAMLEECTAGAIEIEKAD